MVPKDTQTEVYRTVKLRGRSVDATWAPWWRAQATAIAEVLRQQHADKPDTLANVERLLEREMQFAQRLEER